MSGDEGPAIGAHYDLGWEKGRLESGGGRIELVRTQEVLGKVLPRAPAKILDVGGAAGVYSSWLAAQGYEVDLVDMMPLHIQQALSPEVQAKGHFTATVGDARSLLFADGIYDVVLTMGPLYHLTDREDRLLSLREAHRVLKPGGHVVAATISRHANLLDSVRPGNLEFPEFRAMIEESQRTGRHRNPDPNRRSEWFTHAHLHTPEEIEAEVAAAGFAIVDQIGVEGPAAVILTTAEIEERWSDPVRRDALLWAARVVERDPAMRALSLHFLTVGRKS